MFRDRLAVSYDIVAGSRILAARLKTGAVTSRRDRPHGRSATAAPASPRRAA
jgi:hypothetical protein